MLFDTKNKLSSQELTDKVISDYNSGVSVDLIISYLEEETRKPTGSSKIDLQSLDVSRPSITPWNTLGLQLLKDKQYNTSEKIWRKLISLASELSAEKYNNVPPVGLPFNNLASVLYEQGKFNDALIALLQAYAYDIQTGHPAGAARPNFIRMFSRVLANFVAPVIEGSKASSGNDDIKTQAIVPPKPSIKGFDIMAWLSFLMPTLFGGYMLFLHPNNWYFLFLILMGMTYPAMYIFKYVFIKLPLGSVQASNEPLEKIG